MRRLGSGPSLSIVTPSGRVEAAAVVLATGAWTARLRALRRRSSTAPASRATESDRVVWPAGSSPRSRSAMRRVVAVRPRRWAARALPPRALPDTGGPCRPGRAPAEGGATAARAACRPPHARTVGPVIRKLRTPGSTSCTSRDQRARDVLHVLRLTAQAAAAEGDSGREAPDQQGGLPAASTVKKLEFNQVTAKGVRLRERIWTGFKAA